MVDRSEIWGIAVKLIVKLAAVVLVPCIALAGFGGFQLLESWKTAQSMKDIESLSALAVDISNLVHETQKERGRTAGFLGSKGTKFSGELTDQRAQADDRIRTLEASMAGLDRSGCNESLLALLDSAMAKLDKLASVRGRVSSMDIATSEAIGYYTGMNADFLNAIGAIAANSDDPGLNTTLLAYSMFLKSKERAGIERAVMSNTFARDNFGPGMHAKFISLMSQQETYLNEFMQVASESARSAYKDAAHDPSFGRVEGMRSVALEKVNEGGFGIDPGEWFATITSKINKLKEVEDNLASGVAAQAGTIRAAATTRTMVSAVVVFSVLSISFVFGIYIARSVATRVSRISREITEAESTRNLTTQMEVLGNDEISTMAISLNRFLNTIHDLVADVGRVSEEVAGAATEMAATSDQFAAGLENQSMQTTEAAAAVEELAASVRQISSHSVEASEAAEQSRHDAELGGQIVRDTVAEIQAIAHDVRDTSESINELGKRSEQIGQIINVINDIADQTNLLALNAAIEAARAGEHGRGFAVVADEVRKLAERTSAATQEVSDAIGQIQTDTRGSVERIESSVSRVDSGVELASSAGEALERIVQAAHGLGQMVSSISDASKEQSVASDDLSQRIDAVRLVASESNLAASQSAEASGNMSSQAERLRELVGSFKI